VHRSCECEAAPTQLRMQIMARITTITTITTIPGELE
jgi:hypothetical protein